MRITTALLAWLLPALALAQADQCFQDYFAALPTTDCGNNVCQSEVNDYYSYLNQASTAHIVDAMDYCDVAGTSANLPSDVEDRLWERFEYAQANPTLGTETVPQLADYVRRDANKFQAGLDPSGSPDCDGPYGCYSIRYTRDELKESWTAKVAHAVWLDVTDALPYKLSEYTELETRYIVDPTHIWNMHPGEYTYLDAISGHASWDTPVASGDYWYENYPGVYGLDTLMLDHSPYEVWEELKTADVHLSNSPRTAINRVMSIAATTVHGNRCDSPVSRSVKDNLDSRNTRGYQRSQLDPSHECYYVTASTQPIMPSGCNDRSRLSISMLLNANIPAYSRNGIQTERGHSMFYLPHHGYYVQHGDDTVYGYPVVPPISATLERYQDFTNSILLPTSCYENSGPEGGPYWLGHYEGGFLTARLWCARSSFIDTSVNTAAAFCALGFEESIGATCRWAFYPECESAFLNDWKARWAALYGCSGDAP